MAERLGLHLRAPQAQMNGSTVPPPELIVGVHVHDDAAGLRRSLPTVVHQRFPGRLRVVVVDDAASGEAREAIDELADRYPVVEVVRNLARSGRAAVRAQVLDVAGGAAVAWLDVGDVWHPRKLARQHAVLAASDDPDSTLVTCSHREVDLSGARERVVTPALEGDLLGRVLDRSLGALGGTLLGTAEAFRSVGGFDVSLPYRDDEELLLRFVAGGGRIVRVGGGPLSTGSVVRDHPTADAVTTTERRIRRLHGASIRRYDASLGRRVHRREMQRASRLHRKEGHAGLAAAYRLRADVTAVVDRIARRVSGRGPDARVAEGDHVTPSAPPRARPGPPTPTAPTAALRSDSSAPAEDPATPPAVLDIHRRADAASWTEALAAWRSVPADLRADADPVTYEVVARSHRALGEHAEAIAIAETGLQRWPRHPRIEIELAKSRAATTDWSEALIPVPGDPGIDTAPGVVTSLGSLAGLEGPVIGRLTATVEPGATSVTVRVNGIPIVATEAASGDGGEGSAGHTFSLSCDQLREFLGDGDRLSVAAGDQALHLEGFGCAAEVRTGYPSRLAALRERLDGGAVFTKFGQLRPGYTPARKRRTLELFDEVAAVVAEAHGYLCTPFYGNLLGAVREQDFIAHDVGGFDAGYVSREQAPTAVRTEFVGLCRRLLDLGFHLEVERFGAMVRRDPGDRIFTDLNYAWVAPDGALQLSYGWRYAPVTDRARIDAPRETYLAGRLVPIPGDAEAILHQVYGPGWATPDQGFELADRLQRDEEFLLHDEDLAAIHRARPDRVRLLDPLKG
jgi:glycosyltransferase involved in cell wall biosynthesis